VVSQKHTIVIGNPLYLIKTLVSPETHLLSHIVEQLRLLSQHKFKSLFFITIKLLLSILKFCNRNCCTLPLEDLLVFKELLFFIKQCPLLVREFQFDCIPLLQQLTHGLMFLHVVFKMVTYVKFDQL